MVSKYPLLLSSPLKDYLWGGTKLRDRYGKESDLSIIAESWEMSCHKDGLSVITNGEYSGKTLKDYIDLDRASVLGTRCCLESGFPVLVKLIDAQKPLSVQVHPDDAYALKAENDNGKTEMWYILESEPDATLVYGVNRHIEPEEFRTLIKEDRLEEVLNTVKVKTGDVIFVPPGTLHAIGSGILIAEVQQSSNATYRVWDYGRVGSDGKPRPLHVDKSIDVAKLYPTPLPQCPIVLSSGNGWSEKVIVDCEYFRVNVLSIHGEIELDCNLETFVGYTCISGSCDVIHGFETFSISAGATFFVPAGTVGVTLCGNAEFIKTSK